MIKIAPIVLTGVVGLGLHIYKTQTNEVAAEVPAPQKTLRVSDTKKVRLCILDSIRANLTEADRKNEDGREKTAEEMETIIARKENEAHQIISKGEGIAFGPIKASCMVKILGPGADVIPDAS